LVYGTERDGIKRDECVVAKDVDAIQGPKVRIESIFDGWLDAGCKAEIMVTGQRSDDLLSSWLGGTGPRGIFVTSKEQFSETDVFIHPEFVTISFEAILGRRGLRCGPFAPSVKEVTEEDYSVWAQEFSDLFHCPLQIEVRVQDGEGGKRPRTVGVRVRVDKLRIGEQDKMVWSRV
jgi:hypothetical protein